MVAVYPNGLYNLTGIKLYDDSSENNFDIIDAMCILGRGVQYSTFYHESNNVASEVSFYSNSLVCILFSFYLELFWVFYC